MFTKLVRNCRDAVLRQTPSGQSVCSMAVAYDIGYGENKKPQYLDLSLWGKRGESLAPYLTKGSQVFVVVDDVHIETYKSQKGSGSKLVGKIVEIELISGNRDQGQQAQPAKQPAKQHEPDEFIDDDLPF